MLSLVLVLSRPLITMHAEIIRRLTKCVNDIYGVTFRSIQAATPSTLGIFQGIGFVDGGDFSSDAQRARV